MTQVGRARVRFPDEVNGFFPFYLIAFAALYSASNRHACQKSFWRIKRDRPVRLTISPPSVSRLPKRRKNLHINKEQKRTTCIISTSGLQPGLSDDILRGTRKHLTLGYVKLNIYIYIYIHIYIIS
jgi:hypothetical protein